MHPNSNNLHFQPTEVTRTWQNIPFQKNKFLTFKNVLAFHKYTVLSKTVPTPQTKRIPTHRVHLPKMYVMSSICNIAFNLLALHKFPHFSNWVLANCKNIRANTETTLKVHAAENRQKRSSPFYFMSQWVTKNFFLQSEELNKCRIFY